MPNRVIAWECQYCGKHKPTRNDCCKHEESCPENPRIKRLAKRLEREEQGQKDA